MDVLSTTISKATWRLVPFLLLMYILQLDVGTTWLRTDANG